MFSDNQDRDHFQTHAAERGAEDGMDPVRFHDRRRSHMQDGRTGIAGRKSLQLCRQVEESLRGILACFADDVLQNLIVHSVEPAPHSGRLLVTVSLGEPSSAAALKNADIHLRLAAGRIRSEVAAEVNRRKAPELVFQVV